jgi:hypothetical protein
MEPIFAADPDIIDLERRFNASHTELKWEYKFIEQAPEKRKEHIISPCTPISNTPLCRTPFYTKNRDFQ